MNVTRIPGKTYQFNNPEHAYQYAEYIIKQREIGPLFLHYLGLTKLPPIPEGVTILFCNTNHLTTLDNLPSTLTTLFCDHNL